MQLDFLMESTWKNHVKSPKLDLEKNLGKNLGKKSPKLIYDNEFDIISEMCSFILSWFSKFCDFEWGLFVFGFELFCIFKRLYTAKQLK